MSSETSIHPTAVIDEGATIGAGSKVWHFCHVMADSHIGENCMLGQNVFVASGVRLGKGVRVQNNVSLYEGVTLEDDVFVGPSVVFTNVHHPRVGVNRHDQFLTTIVRRGATLGANSTVVCGHEIGPYALVAAGAVVTRDVPAQALVAGVPARQQGWVCLCGTPLPERQGGTCPECQRRFEERGQLVDIS